MTTTSTTRAKSNHFFEGNFAPVDIEQDLSQLQITGEMPKELCGTLYRVGPNPQYAPRDDNYHWFAGDGMVHAFTIEDGKVSYKNRWMRTPKWELENRAEKALFGTFGNPATTDPTALGQNAGTANTNVVWHGNRLFALEESHQPFEFDGVTLVSKGHQDFDGKVTARFTAHPRIDPATGDLHFFAYSLAGPGSAEMLYGVLDSDCKVTRLDAFSAPYASMVHDFVATQSYVLFPAMPLTSSMERVMCGKPMFAWESDRMTHIGILRKGGHIAEMRWLETDACHVFHFMNAWEDGEKIVAYAMESETAPGLPNADGSPGDPQKMTAYLSRWTIDLHTGGVKRERLDDLPAEFPRIDDRYSGTMNQYGWYVCHADRRVRDDTENVMYGALACFDFKTGNRSLFVLPEGDVISEPVFVPRSNRSAEGHGWIVAVAWRARLQRSDLLVFDALSIENGPVATAHLPHRVPFGFHGGWRPKIDES